MRDPAVANCSAAADTSPWRPPPPPRAPPTWPATSAAAACAAAVARLTSGCSETVKHKLKRHGKGKTALPQMSLAWPRVR